MWAFLTSLSCTLALPVAQEAPLPADQAPLPWSLTWRGFPRLTAPGPIWIDFHNRFSLDSLIAAGRQAGGESPGNDNSTRTARLQAFLESPWVTGRAQWEFSGNDIDFRELSILTEVPGVHFTAGQTREPAGLGALIGAGQQPFPERSATTQAFTPGRNLGLVGRVRSGPWSAWLGAFRASEEFSFNPQGEGESVTARAVWVDGDTVPDQDFLHLGFWLSQRNNGLLFESRPGVQLLPRLISTGPLGSADALVGGLEFGWQRNGWTVNAELQAANIDLVGDSALLSGAVVEASWRPAGEVRGYARGKGAFRGFIPNNPAGAAELALRVGRTELDDGSINGGTQNDIGFGLNVQLSERSRWMLHWQRSRAGDADVRTILFRLQLGR